MQQTTLTAPKISCGHCKVAVETAARGLAGVASVAVDPETKKIELTWDDNVVTIDEIKKVIAEAGYPTD